MKIMGIIAIAMLTAAFLFLACNDSSTELLTGTQDTQLAGATADYQVRVTSRTGDGPEIVQMVSPAIWDGKSDFVNGAVYHWNSLQEALEAYKDRDPEKYEDLKQWGEDRVNGTVGSKAKEKASTKLASVPSPACRVRVSGYQVIASTEVTDPGNPTSPYFSRIRLLLSKPPPIMAFDEYDHYWYDGQARYRSLHYVGDCPVEIAADAKCWWNGDGYWVAYDAWGCD